MNHERAMNRLTDMLRNAQTTCTDTECFTGPCKIENKHSFISKIFFYLRFSTRYTKYWWWNDKYVSNVSYLVCYCSITLSFSTTYNSKYS